MSNGLNCEWMSSVLRKKLVHEYKFISKVTYGIHTFLPEVKSAFICYSRNHEYHIFIFTEMVCKYVYNSYQMVTIDNVAYLVYIGLVENVSGRQYVF